MKNVVILENIRSAYNVGNIIRTADALGWEVWLVGYTPSPSDNPKVIKSSLGAEESVSLRAFVTTDEAIGVAKKLGYAILAAECTVDAVDVREFRGENLGIVLIMGNEVVGVDPSTLKTVDHVVCIPMQGKKESLNVGQAAAIMMRELS